MKEQEKKTFLH